MWIDAEREKKRGNRVLVLVPSVSHPPSGLITRVVCAKLLRGDWMHGQYIMVQVRDAWLVHALTLTSRRSSSMHALSIYSMISTLFSRFFCRSLVTPNSRQSL